MSDAKSAQASAEPLIAQPPPEPPPDCPAGIYWSLLCVIFTDALGLFLAVPLIPLIGRDFDATSVQIGYLVGCFSLFNAIGTLMWGVISDYLDKKLILLINLVGLTSGYIVSATAPSYTVLLCGRAVTGFCSATAGVANSLLFEYSHVSFRARDARYTNLVSNIAITLAPACGGLFIGIGGWRGVMSATSVTCIANFLICAILAPHDRKQERTTKQDPVKLLVRWLFTERGSIAIFAGHWLMFIGSGLVFATFVLVNSMLYGFTPSENYFSFAMGGAVAVVVGLSCDIVSMIGAWWGVVFRSISLILCLLFYIFARFHAVPFVFLAMWTSVFTFGMPATVVLLSACPEEALGTGIGLWTFLLFSGEALGMAASGYLLDRGLMMPFWAAVAMMMGSLLCTPLRIPGPLPELKQE